MSVGTVDMLEKVTNKETSFMYTWKCQKYFLLSLL